MSNVIVNMKNITKEFPGVKALDNASLEIRSGEVMALLGENGAGKSTLMKILSGVYTRDSGKLEIFGQEFNDLTPKQAQELGIAIIHQELNLCGHLTVADNIFLGNEIKKGPVLDKKSMYKKSKEILDKLQVDIDPNDLVSTLSISKQQMVEIAKALSMNAKVLIMDEPTSALTSVEIDQLFGIIKKLKSEGCGIVYISHRLEELEEIVDRVTVMRDGKFVIEEEFKNLTLDEIIKYMVGREITNKFPRIECKKGKKILEVKNLNAGKQVRDVSFDVYEGEILGIAGLMGAGRTEITRALFGVDKIDSGQIILDGKDITVRKPKNAIEAGIVLAPEDRRLEGLCTGLSVKENLSLANLDMISNKTGFINSKKEKKMADKAVTDLQIRLANFDVNAGSLSGGNQQKVVVGKWLIRNSRVVIFDEPTRGVDVAAKVEIYNLMNNLKAKGVGVLFVSSEMNEVLGIADRILVMCDGRITGEMGIEDASQEKIMKLATSFEKKHEKSDDIKIDEKVPQMA